LLVVEVVIICSKACTSFKKICI